MAFAYVYRASLLCEDCANDVKLRQGTSVATLAQLEAIIENPDKWPQGPYDNGGGEADTPQHCDMCHVHLENPMTTDGYVYLADAIEGYRADGSGSREVLATWVNYYLDGDIETWLGEAT